MVRTSKINILLLWYTQYGIDALLTSNVNDNQYAVYDRHSKINVAESLNSLNELLFTQMLPGILLILLVFHFLLSNFSNNKSHSITRKEVDSVKKLMFTQHSYSTMLGHLHIKRY